MQSKDYSSRPLPQERVNMKAFIAWQERLAEFVRLQENPKTRLLNNIA